MVLVWLKVVEEKLTVHAGDTFVISVTSKQQGGAGLCGRGQ